MYGKKLVTNKQDIVDFLNKIEEEIGDRIGWEDQYLPERFPSIMVIVIPPTKAMYFSVYWMHVWPEDFAQPTEEIN